MADDETVRHGHMGIPDIAARVRREEYTGENRCLPCTVLNVVIAATIGGGLAGAGYPGIGAVAVVVGFAAIYLRGYLVPGTPAVTKRYLPAGLLRLFGKEPAPGRERGPRADSSDPGTRLDALLAAGVLADDSAAGDVRLAPRFEEAWRDALDSIGGRAPGPDDVAAMLGAGECAARGDASFVVEGDALVRWESGAALRADVAAAAALPAHLDGWSRLDRSGRLDVLTGLRLFLERCPSCGGPVSRTERRVDPCCQPAHATTRSACEACGATIANVSVPGPDDETPTRVQFLSA